ncbi:MAG: hypothetical protein GQ526_06395 [Ardenticatenales bacterium]|nr:hypothetical protein [Ardenticatenales bacterium]
MAVLITPFAFALASDHREALVRKAARVLGADGYCLLTERDPAAHQFDKEQHLSAVGFFQLLPAYGFVTMLDRRIWQQPVTVPFLHNWAHQRQPYLQLAALTDTDCEAGLDDLRGELEALNLEHFRLSQLVVSNDTARCPSLSAVS